jgi:hypothetical protein
MAGNGKTEPAVLRIIAPFRRLGSIADADRRPLHPERGGGSLDHGK